MVVWASLLTQWERTHLSMQDMQFRSLGQEDCQEKEMATHSSILAWRISWTEEPGGLHSMGSQRVRHDWATEHTLVVWHGVDTIFLQWVPLRDNAELGPRARSWRPCVCSRHVPKLHKAGHRAASFRSCGSLPVGAGLRAVAGPQQLSPVSFRTCGSLQVGAGLRVVAGPQQLSPVLRTACLLFSLRPRRWDGVGQARGGGHSPNPHAKLCAQTWQGIVKTHPKQCG